tara:strand:- start:66990 stop:68759 length:1770 start_codon:yes stop_codon:yes gene_type:complete
MTITPISQFGNTPASLTGGGQLSMSSAGGFAAFFAALLGGQSQIPAEGESVPEGLDGLLGLLSSDEGVLDGDLGAALEAFVPPEVDAISLNLDGFVGADGVLEAQSLDADSNPFLNAKSAVDVDHLHGLLDSFSEGSISYEELFVEVRQTVIHLQKSGTSFGDIKGVDGLANAYEKMGLSPEDALKKATDVVTAIALMRQRFGIEVAGEEKPDLITSIFNMASEQSDVFSSDLTLTQISMQMSQSMIAFEASSTLSSGDIGMTILKGDSLNSVMHDSKFASSGKQASLSDFVVPEGDVEADGFEPLNIKDIATPIKGTTQSEVMAQAKSINTPAQVAVAQTKSADVPQGVFAASAEKMAQDERQSVKRDISNIAADKVITNKPAENLFTVKPQVTATGEGKMLELETAEGEKVDLENIDQNFDEVMEVVARRTSFEARVDGRSQQAMVKQANIASQVDIQMKSLVKQGGGQIRFRLDPPELGELDIKLNISKGVVRGTIVVQSIEAAEHLARDLRILQQSFEEAGLELHKEGIQFKLEDNNQGQEQQASGRGGKGSNAQEDDDGFLNVGGKAEESANWVKPDALVDVSV